MLPPLNTASGGRRGIHRVSVMHVNEVAPLAPPHGDKHIAGLVVDILRGPSAGKGIPHRGRTFPRRPPPDADRSRLFNDLEELHTPEEGAPPGEGREQGNGKHHAREGGHDSLLAGKSKTHELVHPYPDVVVDNFAHNDPRYVVVVAQSVRPQVASRRRER